MNTSDSITINSYLQEDLQFLIEFAAVPESMNSVLAAFRLSQFALSQSIIFRISGTTLETISFTELMQLGELVSSEYVVYIGGIS